MRIDNLPSAPLVNQDGTISDQWRNSFQQMVSQLQSFLSAEKYQLPLQPPLRAPAQSTTPFDTQSNFGSLYHNSSTNNMCVNIKTYTSSAPASPSYQFTPVPSFQSVATVDDLNTIPTAEINGKQVSVTAEPNKIYVGVGNGWQVITTTDA